MTDTATNPVPGYDDYLTAVKNAVAANSSQAPVKPGVFGLISWLDGGQRNALTQNAALAAPGNYFKMLQGQNTAQGGQLDNAQTVTFMNRFRAAQRLPPIDPNNIPGSFAPPAPGNGAPAMPSPVGAPAVPPAQQPVGGAPNAAPGAPAAPTNPADALRATYSQMAASMAGLPKFAPQALDYTKLAQTGLPTGVVATPGGPPVDALSGVRISPTSVPAYNATAAGLTSAAQANAALPAKLTEQNNQAANTFSDITDANGNKVPISNLDLHKAQAAARASGSPLNRGLADNPYRPEQIKQTAKAQDDAAGATQMQNAVDQLGGAIKQFGTSGPWAQHAVDILRGLNQAGLLDKATSGKLAAGELATMDSNTVAAGMARQLTQGGRMLAGVFNQVVKAKPSILTGNPTLALEALHQEMQRQKDMGSFVPQYYADHANASKLDAMTAFDKSHPVAKYQSYVLPLSKPADGKYQVGYAYRMKDGATAIYNGRGFDRYNGLGQ